MKHLLLLAAAAVAFVFSGCQSSAPEKTPDLVLHAHSRYQIVVPDRHANPGTSRYV